MWLVIGYGSTLHGDDRLGPAVAEAVQECADAGLVRVLTAIQLTVELAESVSTAQGVIFIDAARTLRPGELRSVRLEPSDPAQSADTFTHDASPATLLAYARALYGHAPPAWLYTLGGADYALGEELSPVAAALLPRAVTHILRRVGADPAHR